MSRVCVGCGYSGPGAACTICRGEGKASAACSENFCPLCSKPMRKRFDWLQLVSVLLCGFGAGVLALLVCTLLGGCIGPEFTANADLFTADASTDADSGAGEAGAGGAAGDSGDAGTGGAVSEPAAAGSGGAAAGSAGAASAGSAGALAVGGGGAGGATPCGVVGWQAVAFASYDPPIGGPPSAALDGDLTTRWASGVEQAPGQWFQVNLPAGTVLEQLELEGAAANLPIELELELDGSAVAVTQSMRAPGVLGLVLAKPTPARVLRLLITTPAAGEWWAIRELRPVCK